MSEGLWKGASVVVLLGGESRERDVSLVTGQAIASALLRQGFAVTTVDWRGDREAVAALLRLVEGGACDVIFNALHGGSGESGPVQGFLEMIGVPYTGSGVLASALAMDKDRSKHLAQTAGVPTSPWVVWDRATAQAALDAHQAREAREAGSAGEAMEAPAPPGLPLVVKPTLDGSSVGVSLVRDARDLAPALAAALAGRGDVLMEALIEGPEVSVAVLDGHALGVCEIQPQSGFYTYEAKYQRNDTRYLLPTTLGEGLEAELCDLAQRVYQRVGCRGVARVDFIVRDRVEPIFLEVNTMPGMTPSSLVPKIAAARGTHFDALVVQMLNGASV
jgi:D-alanine-D-alanine ligase